MSLELISLIFTVVVTMVSGGFALWNMMDRKIKDTKADIMEEVKKLETAQSGMVSRDEFQNSLNRMDKVMESVGLAIRDGNDTLTKRIDSVLFEIGRSSRNG
jgi:hypothetical protein